MMNIIFFDGDCVFCNDTVKFILKNEKDSSFYFCPLQSDFAKETLAVFKEFTNEFDSLYVLKDGRLYSRSEAVLQISKTLNFPYSMGKFLVFTPKFLRNFLYDWIAKHRYQWFGKKENCFIPSEKVKKRFLM